jgi:hypothetical protein
MDLKDLIPYTESLPAPPQILILLEQLFFLIHIVLINSILGLSLIIIYKRIRLLSISSLDLDIYRPFSKQIPILFALAINMAIPALLFLQVVFGHLFYTSSVLLGTYWILIIPLLIAGYYSSYIHYKKFESSQLAKFTIFAVVFIMLYISFILVNNLSLMENLIKWSRYFENRSGTILLWDEISIYPRYLHFIVASLAVGGLFYSLHYKFKKDLNQNLRNIKIKEGLKIFTYSTMVQVIVGVLFLLSLPQKVMLNFMGADILATLIFILGVIFAVVSIVAGLKGKLGLTVIFLSITLIAMVINRYHLRVFQLGEHFSLSQLNIVPQWDVFAIFLIILIFGIAVILYMLKIAFAKGDRG